MVLSEVPALVHIAYNDTIDTSDKHSYHSTLDKKISTAGKVYFVLLDLIYLPAIIIHLAAGIVATL